MNSKNIAIILATFVTLSMNGIGYCAGGQTYAETVNLIKNLLPVTSSDVRREIYGYIRFDECKLDYNVSGVYPVGTPYDISFSGLDFAGLDLEKSKIGVDSSYYVLLKFNKPFNNKTLSTERTVNIVVFDAASEEKAATLFQAFLHLGELCGALGK
jgi:hypothetical protein